MEEEPIQKEQEQPVVEKKVYTPPSLNIYGKLTELTAGGSVGPNEGSGSDPNRRT